MTGSSIQTGFRNICRRSNAAVALANENVADRDGLCRRTSQRQFNAGKHGNSKRKQMEISDDSEYYETTASQDERIEQELRKEKEEEKSAQERLDSQRQEEFEEVFEKNTDEVFHLPGLTFLKFNSQKIKFCFEPRKVVRLINKDAKFYCSLKYCKKYNFWRIRRDSFPVNCKWQIYSIFCKSSYVQDHTILYAICKTYLKLKTWARENEAFRQERFMRYQNGKDVELDSDDEELFLTEDERKQLKAKREAILKRMIPPTDPKLLVLPPETPKRKRKKKKRPVSRECTPPTRRRPIARYQSGEAVELDSDDEELFSAEDDRRRLKAKGEAVLKWMIPLTDPKLLVVPSETTERERNKKKKKQPVSRECTPPKRRRRIRVFSTSGSD